MGLQDLLDAYAAMHGMSGLPLDANGMCRLRFGDAIDVNIESSKRPGHAHLYAVVGRLPKDAGVSHVRRLLEWNVFGRETGGASLGCDPETDEVLLWRLIEFEDLSAERFDRMLRDLVQATARLTDKLKGEAADGREAGTNPMLMETFYLRA